MYELLILLAGLVLGLAHEADKRQEAQRAYRAGQASMTDKPRRDHRQTINAVYHSMQATGRGTARMQ